MLKEILALQDARQIVSGKWGGEPTGSVADRKLSSIRQYLQDRLDILGMFAENRMAEEA